MGARKKLNQAYFNGALVCGGVVGLLSESWLGFTLAFLGCLAYSYYGGEIRTDRRRRR